MPPKEVIAIVGPTASGKTQRAVSLAKLLNAEVISADSRQVYRGMDLGTGKDLEEYGNVPYHLIDICAAGEKYNLHRYIADFNRVLAQLKLRGKKSIVCGGSGMYIENALSGIILPDVPENQTLRLELEKKSLEELERILSSLKTLHNKTDVDTKKRAIRAIEIEKYYLDHRELSIKANREETKPIDSIIIGVDIPREERRKRISERLEKRLNSGMIEEVMKLLDSGVRADDLIYYGLEYKFLTLHLLGKIGFEEMKSQLEIAIHQFAKRQMTWFRGMEKRGFKIHWLPYNLPENDFNRQAMNLFNQC